MGEDGSIVFRVDADDQDAQKKLDKLYRDIEKTAKAIEGTTAKRNGIAESLETARAAAEKTAQEIQRTKDLIAEGEKVVGTSAAPGSISVDDYNNVVAAQDKLREKLKEQEAAYAAQTKEVQKLEGQEQKVLSTLQEQNNVLRQQKSDAGAVERVLSSQSKRTLPGLSMSATDAGRAFKKGFRYLLKWGFGIKSTFILFRKLRSAITETIKALGEQDEETRNNINNLKASLSGLKASWGAAFAPIFNVVAPYIRQLIDWMTAGANAVQMFFAVLSGKSSYKKAVAGNAALADSYGAAGKAAKDAAGDIADFDEITKLSDNETGGGGGGSGSDVSWEDTPIDNDSLAARLAMQVKDVLFDWDDLTPEQIAKKAIAGLATLLGASVGFMIGGVPGAVVGTLLGFTLGIVADEIIFDDDGQLSSAEKTKILKLGIGALLGGITGFVVTGSFGGALIGATVGIGLALSVVALKDKIETEGMSVGEFGQIVKVALAGLLGAAIGMTLIPGFLGAALGGTIAMALVLALDNEATDASSFGSGIQDALIDSIESTDFMVLHNVLNYKLGEALFGKKFNDWWFSQGDYAGKELIMGLINGAEENTPKAETTMKKEAKKPVSKWWEGMKERWPVEETWIYKAITAMTSNANKQAENEMKSAGTNTTKGFWSGLESRWPVEETWIYKAFPGLINSVKKILGISSPSTVFSGIGENIVNGLVNGAEGVWSSVTSFFSRSIDDIRSLMDFSWSFPAPKMPHFTWWWESIGNLVSIPRFSIEWYARGGVFDQASLIGVGENGSEAVVPLERNTGWMNTVAEGIVSRLLDNDRFTDAITGRALPAYATGSITPPGAVGRGYDSLAETIGDSVTEAINVAFDRAFSSAFRNFDNEREIAIYLDGKEITRTVTKYQRQFARAAG